jgi:hypothetical protein
MQEQSIEELIESRIIGAEKTIFSLHCDRTKFAILFFLEPQISI